MSSKQNNKIKLSTIYKDYFDLYLQAPKCPITKDVFKAVNQTMACRTARIGINVYQCPDCEEQKYVLRSCKNRFCPTCGYVDTKRWANKMLEKIADCAHHHIVFTLPASLRKIGRMYKEEMHSLLLKSSAETMINWFGAKHRLEPGIMNVLHTAGSDQKYHPHVHMICSAGGTDKNGKVQALKKSPFLINQQFLSKKFRWHFEKGLFELYHKGKIENAFNNIISLKKFVKDINKQDWVVSVQAPLKKADDIVNYVGRYTKRACISEYNILSADKGEICYKYKDYKRVNHRGKAELSELTLSYQDFFARLFEHVPSKGFRMVRYYGMYSTRKIKKQQSINKSKVKQEKIPESWRDIQIHKTGKDPLICPCCNKEMIKAYEHYDNRTRWVRMSQPNELASRPIAV